MTLIIVAFIIWILPCYVAHQIGAPKNRFGLGWGVCLGWLGVIIVALLPPRNQKESQRVTEDATHLR
jgi:hypothetical protein